MRWRSASGRNLGIAPIWQRIPNFSTIGERRKNQPLDVDADQQVCGEIHQARVYGDSQSARTCRAGRSCPTEEPRERRAHPGRDMYVELDHPQRGKWYNVACPIKLSASPAVIKAIAPARRTYRRGAEGSAGLGDEQIGKL